MYTFQEKGKEEEKMKQSKKLEKINQMSKHEIVLDMFEEFLSKKYNLYINYSIHYRDYITFFAREQYGIKSHHRPINLNDSLNQYVNLLNCLKKHPSIYCVLSYDRENEKYKSTLLKEEIKGLEGIDEYITQTEQYSISDDSLFDLLNTLEIYMSEYLEEETNEHKHNKVKKLKRK